MSFRCTCCLLVFMSMVSGMNCFTPATLLTIESVPLRKIHTPKTVVPLAMIPFRNCLTNKHAQISRPRSTECHMGLETVFQINNYMVMPFWLLMIFAPRTRITRTVMNGFFPLIPAIFMYIYLFWINLSAPNGMAIFQAPITLAAIAAEAQKPAAMAAIWAHMVVLDLFVGRWILFDSIRNRVFAAHSLILALFACPVGLLSHIVTRKLVTGNRAVDRVSEGLADSMSDESLMQLVEED